MKRYLCKEFFAKNSWYEWADGWAAGLHGECGSLKRAAVMVGFNFCGERSRVGQDSAGEQPERALSGVAGAARQPAQATAGGRVRGPGGAADHAGPGARVAGADADLRRGPAAVPVGQLGAGVPGRG